MNGEGVKEESGREVSNDGSENERGTEGQGVAGYWGQGDRSWEDKGRQEGRVV